MHVPARPTPARLTRASALLGLLALVVGLLVISTGTAGAQASCFGHTATIIARPGQVTHGTPGRDVIVGTDGADEIHGYGGRDLICTGGGDDAVYGGRGGDQIDLGTGADFARGGPGGDAIAGRDGNDRIRGRKGPDAIDGGAGTDICRGGAGSDRISNCNERARRTSPSSGDLSAAEREMTNLVNGLRANRGRAPLTVSIAMVDVARNWSTELPNGLRHNPSVGNQIPDGWWAWGENVAYAPSVRVAFDALVDSPGHYQNMVDDGFTHVGIGVHVEGSRVYVTQVFATY